DSGGWPSSIRREPELARSSLTSRPDPHPAFRRFALAARAEVSLTSSQDPRPCAANRPLSLRLRPPRPKTRKRIGERPSSGPRPLDCVRLNFFRTGQRAHLSTPEQQFLL